MLIKGNHAYSISVLHREYSDMNMNLPYGQWLAGQGKKALNCGAAYKDVP